MVEEEKMGLLEKVRILRESTDKRTAGRLKLEQLEKALKRILGFAGECTECEKYVPDFDVLLDKIMNSRVNVEKSLFIEYHLLMKKLISHLQKAHKLVPEGYYMEIYMAMGVGLGIPLGFAFKNIALGLPIGISIGLALGAGMDANAKMQDRVI